jgi:hypothetical protein
MVAVHDFHPQDIRAKSDLSSRVVLFVVPGETPHAGDFFSPGIERICREVLALDQGTRPFEVPASSAQTVSGEHEGGRSYHCYLYCVGCQILEQGAAALLSPATALHPPVRLMSLLCDESCVQGILSSSVLTVYQMPVCISGLIQRGNPIPVIKLCRISSARPSPSRSTRSFTPRASISK